MNHVPACDVLWGMNSRSNGRTMDGGAAEVRGTDGGHRPGQDVSVRSRSGRTFGWVLRLLTVAALAVDVYVHASLASTFDPIRATFSQGQLFRVEAAAAAVAGVLILVWANRMTWLFALLVLAGGLAAVLFYALVDPGQLGPMPDMYDPSWGPAKTASAVAEGLGALFAGIGLRRALRVPA
jgi:hypothetical protein